MSVLDFALYEFWTIFTLNEYEQYTFLMHALQEQTNK